ncbi:hypothetical protein ACFORO_10185 [Amycolatopsis halotolerans]|uniref:CNNM transmembrane domain-containing protein n=1 Tax=Amycolatopsis halotolerans TaxID=330083 RepID=A0ABV7QE27_9PSEU
MILARVIVAATLVLAELWSVLAIFSVGFDSRRGNRRLRWITGDDAETVRDRHSLMAQLSMMGIVNTVAGAAAGLGASMYAANNHLQFTQSVVPIFMIGMAVLAVQASGLVVGHWASRPRRAWITNPFVLEATLRQSLREGPVPDHTIDEYEQILEKLRSETSVLFLKKPIPSKRWASLLPLRRASGLPRATVRRRSGRSSFGPTSRRKQCGAGSGPAGNWPSSARSRSAFWRLPLLSACARSRPTEHPRWSSQSPSCSAAGTCSWAC